MGFYLNEEKITRYYMHYHLILNFTKELHTRPYMVTKKVCLEQNISIGSFCASLNNFHNVSTWVKWPQKLVMILLDKKLVHTLHVSGWIEFSFYSNIIKWWIKQYHLHFSVESYINKICTTNKIVSEKIRNTLNILNRKNIIAPKKPSRNWI